MNNLLRTGNRRGIAHLIVILVVLLSSFVVIAVVFKVLPRIKAQLTGMPQGKIVAEPKTTAATGSIKFTAEDVVGVSNAQIDYVRYYLLNPQLAQNNTWGRPNWCSDIEPCTASTSAPFITYDIGESSNPGNDFEINWNGSTTSPDSAGTDRALTPQNIQPGTYVVGLKIRDVDGNENGSASTVTITIESPSGKIQVTPNTTTNNGSVTLRATDVKGAGGAQIDNVRYYLLNPQLASGHNWGDPSWCASANPCTNASHPGMFTYDIGESSNPGNNYEIVWNSSTQSSGSTAYSRALTPQNIPPGMYRIGLRVEDVDGNINGGASEFGLLITDGTLPTNAYKVTYKNNVTGATVTETLSSNVIKFNPGNAAPKPGIGTGNYTVTWEGYQNFAGGYTRFNTQMTGGNVKVYVDGSQVHQANSNGSTQAGKMITAGNHLVKVEYNHVSGSARSWANYVRAYQCSDMTADNIVNSGDQGILAGKLGTNGLSPWDLTADSQVNSQDQNKLATQFNQTCN